VVLATGISSVWNAEFAGVDNVGVGNLNTYVRNSLCSLKTDFLARVDTSVLSLHSLSRHTVSVYINTFLTLR